MAAARRPILSSVPSRLKRNRLWVADITYIPTWSGFLYLAIVLDVFSRRIVGWSMSLTLHADVVLAALNMALAVRKPKGVIHHSDQGFNFLVSGIVFIAAGTFLLLFKFGFLKTNSKTTRPVESDTLLGSIFFGLVSICVWLGVFQ